MNITSKYELFDCFTGTQGKLGHLRTDPETAWRRNDADTDFHSVGNPYVRDFSVVQSSKAWRRMGNKNQVASSHELPHVRNRGTHVGEVMGLSMRMAEHLGLNHELALAIAAGHDIGHVPFGHQGEHFIKERSGIDFTHEVMGVIVAQHVERRGEGLNLTHDVLDGMYRHSGKNVSPDMTQEAWIVRYADKLAYLFSDYNDFTRLGWKSPEDLKEVVAWFGKNQRERTFRAMVELYEESAAAGRVSFEKSEAARNFALLRTLMYKEYVRVAEQSVDRVLEPIYGFLEQMNIVPPWLGIALLTDDEVVRLAGSYKRLSSRHIMDTGLGEIIEGFNRDELFSIKFELDLDW